MSADRDYERAVHGQVFAGAQLAGFVAGLLDHGQIPALHSDRAMTLLVGWEQAGERVDALLHGGAAKKE